MKFRLPLIGTPLREDFDWEIRRQRAAIMSAPKKMREIVEDVSSLYGIETKTIMSDRRLQSIAEARQLAMAKCVEAGFTVGMIELFFKRDHTTISYAWKKYSEGRLAAPNR